jgi:hypothetical protein
MTKYVTFCGHQLHFELLDGRVVAVRDGSPPSSATTVLRLDVTQHQNEEGVTQDRNEHGVIYDSVLKIGALGILLLIDFVAKRGVPARSGKVIMDRLLRLFPGSAKAHVMITATVAAALEHPGLGGEHSYFTSCALREMQNWCTDSIDVEVTGLPKITDH